MTTCPLDEDDLSKWVREFVTGGATCATRIGLGSSLKDSGSVKQLSAWGIPISRNDKGEISKTRILTSR